MLNWTEIWVICEHSFPQGVYLVGNIYKIYINMKGWMQGFPAVNAASQHRTPYTGLTVHPGAITSPDVLRTFDAHLCDVIS